MSRYEIPAKDPRDRVFVGWDRPLETFFGQVYREGLEEDENPIVWVGADGLREIDTIAQLAARLKSYADIDRAMQARLLDDREFGR